MIRRLSPLPLVLAFVAVGCSTAPTVPEATLAAVEAAVDSAPLLAPVTATATAVPAGAFEPTPVLAPQTNWMDDRYAPQRRKPRRWSNGEALLQGYLGVTSVQDFRRVGGSQDLDSEGGSVSQWPIIGGGAQWKLAGERVDFGLEALMSLGGRANGGAFVVGGGGAQVAVSLDLFILEFFGGPFLSIPLGERFRVYGGLGPLIQFAQYHQSSIEQALNGSSSGFGVGGYVRGGFEIEMSPGSYIGLGVRWYDSTVDLNSRFGDLELEVLEAMLTFSIRG
ncbi:MAG: hypothetical protein AAGB93_19480 [Planctomycetota bacterium]